MNLKKLLFLCLTVIVCLHARQALYDDLIDFNFDNADLVEMITMLAAKEEKNVIFPQGALAIKQKVSVHWPEKVTTEN